MKLYKVTYAFDVLVIADDEDAACEIGNDNARDEFNNMSPGDYFEDISEIRRPEDVPENWRCSLPYGEAMKNEHGRELHVTEVLERIIAERPADLPGQQWLFGEGDEP